MATFTIYEVMGPKRISRQDFSFETTPFSLSVLFIYLSTHPHIYPSIYLMSMSISLCSIGHPQWVPHIPQTESITSPKNLGDL